MNIRYRFLYVTQKTIHMFIYTEIFWITIPVCFLFINGCLYCFRSASFNSYLFLFQKILLDLSQRKNYLGTIFSDNKALKRICLERFVVFSICFKT